MQARRDDDGNRTLTASALVTAIEQRLGVPPLVSKVARFLGVGVVGLAVDTAVFSFFYAQGAGAPASRAASLALATLVTWLLNRAITFGATDRHALEEFARYAGVALVVQGFNYGLFLALYYLTKGAQPLACLIVSAVATAAISFTAQSLFTFAARGARRSHLSSVGDATRTGVAISRASE